MTSPFNPLQQPSGLTPNAPGSSPYPIPTFPSPFPQLLSALGQSPSTLLAQGIAANAQAGPSNLNAAQSVGSVPLPNGLNQLEGFSPFNFKTPLSSNPLAPGINGAPVGSQTQQQHGTSIVPTFPRHVQGLSWTNATQYLPPASSTGDRSRTEGYADLVRGIGEAERMVLRAREVLAEIRPLQDGVFGEVDDGSGGSEGMELGLGGMPKLEGGSWFALLILQSLPFAILPSGHLAIGEAQLTEDLSFVLRVYVFRWSYLVAVA